MINVSIHEELNKLKPKITVIGVGGAGGNAVNNMIGSQLEGCDFLVCNTDAQALEGSIANHKIQLGTHVTAGLGAGANPDIGRAAAEESLDEILQYLEGSNMVFVTAGMGGGTGTGAAPVIAQAARDQGILTVGVTTKPFHFEGTTRMKLAEAGIAEMQKYVDTLIVIPNQNLFRIANEKTSFSDAFKLADEVLQSGVRGVTDLMIMPGLINLDFADIRTVMAEMGKAMMGTGEADGERRAIEAAEAAISNPLLDDVSMKGAKGVLINITGGSDMSLYEVDEAANRIRDEVDSEANIIFGSTFSDDMEGMMRVSIVATGIEAEAVAQNRPQPQAVTNANARDAMINRPQGGQTGGSHGGEQKTATTATGMGSMSPAPAPRQEAPVEQEPQRATGTDGYAMSSGGFGGNSTTASAQTQMHTRSAVPQQQPQTPSYGTASAASQMTTQPGFAARQQPQAMRQGNSFIPPKPMDAGSAASAMRQAQPDPFEEADMANGVGRNEMASEPAAPKKQSLFERFTGQQKEMPSAPTPQARPFADQPNLSVEPGGKTGGDDDDLDIPAFLRRQAN